MPIHYLGELAIRVGIIYAGIAGGFFLQKLSIADKIGKWLLFVGINILTPALLITVFLDMDTGSLTSLNWWFIVLVTTLGMVISMGIDWLLLSRTDICCQTKGAEINTTGFMNALFYPFPIIIGILSGNMKAEGLLAASIYLIIQTFYRNTLGVYLGLHYGTPEDRSIRKTIKGMLLFPPTIGMVLGLILRFSIGQITLARHLADFVSLSHSNLNIMTSTSLGFFSLGDHLAVTVFQDITMVLMLALVGLSFKLPKKNEWKEVALSRSIIARFGGGILVAIIVIFLPIPLGMRVAMIIQTLAPPAVANTAYSKYFKLDEILTSRLIAILTLIALLFLPVEIALLVWWIT